MVFRPKVLRQYKLEQPKVSRARDLLSSRCSVTTGTDIAFRFFFKHFHLHSSVTLVFDSDCWA